MAGPADLRGGVALSLCSLYSFVVLLPRVVLHVVVFMWSGPWSGPTVNPLSRLPCRLLQLYLGSNRDFDVQYIICRSMRRNWLRYVAREVNPPCRFGGPPDGWTQGNWFCNRDGPPKWVFPTQHLNESRLFFHPPRSKRHFILLYLFFLQPFSQLVLR